MEKVSTHTQQAQANREAEKIKIQIQKLEKCYYFIESLPNEEQNTFCRKIKSDDDSSSAQTSSPKITAEDFFQAALDADDLKDQR